MHRTWRFDKGMRYRIPLVNGIVAEGSFRCGCYINQVLFYSCFEDAQVPGYRVHAQFFSLYHAAGPNDPINMHIHFNVEDQRSEHMRLYGGAEIEIDVSRPPMSLENIKHIALALDYNNAYVFGRQAQMIPPELRDIVMEYTKIPFGPLRKFWACLWQLCIDAPRLTLSSLLSSSVPCCSPWGGTRPARTLAAGLRPPST